MSVSKQPGSETPLVKHHSGRASISEVRSRICALFSIDFRSLAMVRFAIAGIVLVDLLARSRFIEALYSDAGVLPVRLLTSHDRSLSLHAMHGSVTLQLVLFVLGMIAALMMLIGYRTRFSTFITWTLTVSLHNRNTYLLDGADTLLASMLLWGIFLPLGACWSIDAQNSRTRQSTQPTIISPATVALLLQFVFFYVSAGLAKTGDEWLVTGTAVEIALSQDYWVRALGEYLRQYPQLLRVLTPMVVYFERFAPLLLFVPFFTARVRMIVIVSFWLFMLGLGTTLQLNLMPWVSSVAILPFLPTQVWDFFSTKLKREKSEGVSSPAPWDAAVSSSTSTSKAFGPEQWLVLLLMIFVLVTMPLPLGAKRTSKLQDVSSRLGLNLVWSMYSPPPSYDYVHDVVATLQDGSKIELDNTADEDQWAQINRIHRTYRFKCYMESSVFDRVRAKRYLIWLTRQWEAHRPKHQHPDNVKLVTSAKRIMSRDPPQLYLMSELTGRDLEAIRREWR